MEINVGVSKNHVHLKEETWRRLFGDKPLIKRNDLSQPGQFATIDTVDLKVGTKIIEHVRVVGPFRDYDQVEIAATDAAFLDVDPPRRQSGDLFNTPSIELVGPKGSVILDNSLILAERHIHMSKKMSSDLGLSNKQKVYVYNDSSYLFDALIKVSDDGILELHIDIDESKIYNLLPGSKVDFRVCGK